MFHTNTFLNLAAPVNLTSLLLIYTLINSYIYSTLKFTQQFVLTI